MRHLSATQVMRMSPEERSNMAKREAFKGMGEVDILKAWYESDEPFALTEREEEIRKRWEWAKAKFLDRKSYTETVHSLESEFGVSVAQARIDIRNMRVMFGPLDEVPKLAKRQLAMQMALDTFEMAKTNEDPDGMAKATQAYIKASGLDKEDTEPFDLDKVMKDRTYVEILDPQVRTLMLNLLKNTGGSTDVSAIFEKVLATKQNESYVDYEELEKQDGAENDK